MHENYRHTVPTHDSLHAGASASSLQKAVLRAAFLTDLAFVARMEVRAHAEVVSCGSFTSRVELSDFRQLPGWHDFVAGVDQIISEGQAHGLGDWLAPSTCGQGSRPPTAPPPPSVFHSRNHDGPVIDV
jgi:hypothetical protein